jgi:hypothetical protein
MLCVITLKNYFCRFGDWNPVIKTACQITSSFSFLHDCQRMVDMATALGETADALHYTNLLIRLKPEWHAAFWDETIQAYGAGTVLFPL